MTLAILLFTDASTLGVRTLRRSGSIPVRLLSVGLPLAIIAGALLGHWLLAGLTWGLAFLVSTILAPTDAALSLGVMTSPWSRSASGRLAQRRERPQRRHRDAVRDRVRGDRGGRGVTRAALAARLLPARSSSRWRSRPSSVGWARGWACWPSGGAGPRGMSPSLLVLGLPCSASPPRTSSAATGSSRRSWPGSSSRWSRTTQLQSATEFSETFGVFMSYVVWALFGSLLLGPMLTRAWDLARRRLRTAGPDRGPDGARWPSPCGAAGCHAGTSR